MARCGVMVGNSSREIRHALDPPVANGALNSLFKVSWPDHKTRDFVSVLQHSLVYVCAYDHDRLIGFVNVAWDGGLHAFLLDPTVHPDYRRRGIGSDIVRRAIDAAKARGVEWVHVDFVPELQPFYRKAGFRPTSAGILRVGE